jgi:hypothetical protein
MMGIDIEICYGPTSPLEKLFVWYLLAAVCAVLAQAIQLACALWSFRRKREFLHDETIAMDLLVQAALKGRLKSAFKLSDGDVIDRTAALFRVDCIETKFLYLWETCYAKVQSLKTLTYLTVILSCFVTAIVVYNACIGIRVEETTAGPSAIAGGVAEGLVVLAAGLLISAFFHVVSRRFEGTLARRRRDWNYNKARFTEELSSSGNEPLQACASR